MKNIFETTGELNNIKNGLILSAAAENRIVKRHLVFVPNIADEFSNTSMNEWAESSPKKFKIRILQLDAKGMNSFYLFGENIRKT